MTRAGAVAAKNIRGVIGLLIGPISPESRKPAAAYPVEGDDDVARSRHSGKTVVKTEETEQSFATIRIQV